MNNCAVGRWVLAAVVCAAAVLDSGSAVHAWRSGGHKLVTRVAAGKLPDGVPEFFRKGGETLAELACEPDNWKDPAAPHLRASERPEHYIDLEYLEGQPMFASRAELQRYYFSKNIDPGKGGCLPNAILENYERLLLAFRDYRLRPGDPGVQQKILVYAGWLAHYCEDAGMPLHTTRDFDGRPGPNGQPAHPGIHARIDAWPEKHLAAGVIEKGLAAEAAAGVWPLITRTILESHKNVDRCYELDAEGAFEVNPEKGRAFMGECVRAAAKLTLDLWYSAWINSEKIPEAKAGGQ